MKPSPQKFCINAKQIARLLCGKAGKRQVEQVVEWMQRQDFPKKEKHKGRVFGWTVESLRAFQTKILPEITKLRAEQKILDPDSKFTATDFKLAQSIFQTAREQDKGKETGDREKGSSDDTPTFAQNLTNLAVIMARHYSGQIRIHISKQMIEHWKKGEGLHGTKAPPFPLPDPGSGRYVVRQCLDWFDKWLLPIHRVNSASAGPTLPGVSIEKLQEERLQEELEEIEHNRMLRDIEKRKWCAVSVVGRLALGAARTISARHNAGERMLPMGLEAILKEAGLPDETRLAILEKFRAVAVRWNEEFQQGTAQALLVLADDSQLFPEGKG